MLTLENGIRAAGILQLGLLSAAFLVPRVLDWRAELARLTPFLRRLIWVYGVFIALTFVGFGILSLLYATPLSSGQPLARGVCAFIGIFWTARLAVQLFVLDARPYLRGPVMRAGHGLLTLTFVYLAGIYALAAFVKGAP